MKNNKRWFYTLLAVLFTILIVGLMTACEPLPPVMDERCVSFEDYSFYQIEKDTALGTKDQWILETADGTIEISNGVYDGAMNYEYSEICYERSDGEATIYKYTKKSDDIRPEPIIETVIEYVTVYEAVEVIVKTHAVLETPMEAFGEKVPTTVFIDPNVGWVIYTITEELRAGVDTHTEFDVQTNQEITVETPWELPNFQIGDKIIVTYLFMPKMIADDMYWKASITHLRSGVTVNHYNFEEEFTSTSSNNLEEYLATIFETYPENLANDIRSVYNLMYGGE